MLVNIKLLKQTCCEELLKFETDPDLRRAYSELEFPIGRLHYIDIPSKFSIDDSLLVNTDAKDDCANSIKLFKALEKLDRVQANDKRFWVCLTHTIFYRYTTSRWKINNTSSDDTLISRFHFEGNGLEGRMRNSVSRLWWAAKITVDENRTNPFELTQLLWEKQDIITSLVERSFGTYRNVLHGFLEFYKKNKHLKEDQIRILARGLNALGGVKVLPIMSINNVIDELKKTSTYNKIDVD